MNDYKNLFVPSHLFNQTRKFVFGLEECVVERKTSKERRYI